MNWRNVTVLLWMSLAGSASAESPANQTIWLGLSFETQSFAKEVRLTDVAKALKTQRANAVISEASALEAAQWYAEEVLPATARQRASDQPTWKRASIEKIPFPVNGTVAFVIELIPPIPEGGLEGLPGVARLLVAVNGCVLDVTSQQPAITFRSPLRALPLLNVPPFRPGSK
jgi:hypothetical protein